MDYRIPGSLQISEGTLMGSPSSLAIVNIFTNHLEKKVINSFSLKPTCWLRYVNVIFIIWPFKKEFVKLLITPHSIHPDEHSEMKKRMHSFLDILITKKQEVSTTQSHINLAEVRGILEL